MGKQISYTTITIQHIFGNMDVCLLLNVDSMFIMQILEIPHNSQEFFYISFIFFQTVKNNMVYQHITDLFLRIYTINFCFEA